MMKPVSWRNLLLVVPVLLAGGLLVNRMSTRDDLSGGGTQDRDRRYACHESAAGQGGRIVRNHQSPSAGGVAAFLSMAKHPIIDAGERQRRIMEPSGRVIPPQPAR